MKVGNGVNKDKEHDKLTDIKGIIFDYGGTIDTNSRHWAEVLWESMQRMKYR